MQRYPVHPAPDPVMESDELLSYLRNMDCDKYNPMDGILSQTEAIGDPALPGVEQSAVLAWLGDALDIWERHYAPEEPLAGEIRRLKPLLAAVAVTDSNFLIPGNHPLHQLLDTIQSHAVGWQPRLGRVGQALQDQVRDVVDATLGWFDSPATDLARISADMSAKAAKAAARARRMAQRLIDTEQGRIRIAKSKQQAALMINAALGRYRAPAEIGDFLKGPWYDNAQFVLLKFGGDSAEWEDISGTTTRLLDSLQNPVTGQEDDPARRQYLFAYVSQVRKDLRRCLRSLKHDREAVDEILDMLEVFHTSLLRRQPLQLETVCEIETPGESAVHEHMDEALDWLEDGQWFALDTDNSPSLRVTLAGRISDEQQLVFVNQAGIKVLQPSYPEFIRLMREGKATPLDSGACFSLSLARAAGLETREDLDELTGVAAERALIKQQEQQKAEQERERLEFARAEQERAERELELRKQQKIEELEREWEKTERLRHAREEAESKRREQFQSELRRVEHEREDTRQLQKQWEAACRKYRQGVELERQDMAEPAGDTESRPDDTDLVLPRGCWVGFRNAEEVELARLAVHDRARNDYIFVDRYGAKKRQLDGQQLLILLTRGQLDVFGTRSGFRDEVGRAQEQAQGRRSK